MIDDVAEFWDERHRTSDEWRSGGDKGLSEAENRQFYAIRTGKLLELLRDFHVGRGPLTILDAGCGRGIISRTLSECEHLVDGIDFSSHAVEYCKAHSLGSFTCADLAEFRPGKLYDAVLLIDVLFHVLDDSQWERSLTNMCSLTKAQGSLIVTDVFGEKRLALSDYIIHRQKSEYTRVLGARGFVMQRQIPYGFGSNPNSFGVFHRSLKEDLR